MEEAADFPERVRLGRLFLEAADQEHLRQEPLRGLGVDAKP
jgi:hypothetical protein